LQAAPSLKNPVINSIGQLIGVLYVVEGSTLGAQLIARSLEKHHGLNQTKGGRFFTATEKKRKRTGKILLASSKPYQTNPSNVHKHLIAQIKPLTILT